MTDFTRASLLVVDGDAAARRATCGALAGFRVARIVECADVHCARYRIETDTFDVLLIAFDMDEGDGEGDAAGFVRALRRMKGNPNRKAPVLVLAGALTGEQRGALSDAGIDAVLPAMPAPADLLVRLGAVLQARRPFVETRAYIGPCRRNGARLVPDTPAEAHA